MLAACLASFKRQSAAFGTTCAAGDQSCARELLGVVCVDIYLLVNRSRRALDEPRSPNPQAQPQPYTP